MAAPLSLLRHKSPLRIRLYSHAQCLFQFIFLSDFLLNRAYNWDADQTALRRLQATHHDAPVRFSLLLCHVPFFLRSRLSSVQPYALLCLHLYHMVYDFDCYSAPNINSQCQGYRGCAAVAVPLHFVTRIVERPFILFWDRLVVVAVLRMPGHQSGELGRHFSELHIFCQRNTTVRPICTLDGHFNFLLPPTRHRFRLWGPELFFPVMGLCRSSHLSGPILPSVIHFAVLSHGIWHSGFFGERWERKRGDA